MSRPLSAGPWRRLSAVILTGTALSATMCAPGDERGAEVRIEHVHGLGLAGRSLYVATHHGLFVHDGQAWSKRSEDAADHMGFTLVSEDLMFRSGHPEEGGNLGVQRSTDGGRRWTTVSNVLESPVDFHAMAGGGEPLALYGWAGTLFRSIGVDDAWEAVEGGGLPDAVAALAVSTGTVYASTNEGVFRSTDRGETWSRASDELVFALAVSGDDLYGSPAEGGAVLRSSDGGRTWEETGGPETAEAIVALASDGRTVVAADATGSISRSTDGGETWSEVPGP